MDCHWHEIYDSSPSLIKTEAMNVYGGVLIRSFGVTDENETACPTCMAQTYVPMMHISESRNDDGKKVWVLQSGGL